MCREKGHRNPEGIRCDGGRDPVYKAVTVAKQSMNRHLRAIDEAEEAGDTERLDKHLEYFNTAVQRLVEREEAQAARIAEAAQPEAGNEENSSATVMPPPAPSRVAEFTDESVSEKTDDELWEIGQTLHFDPEAQDRVWDIIDRRTEAKNDAAALASFEEYQADGPLDWNVVDLAQGDEGEYEMPDLTDAEMFRAYAAAGAAKSADHQCRDAYEQYNAAQYNRALEACSGVLLNARGKAKKVDSYSLFQGNGNTAKAYASEELQSWWRDNGRRSYAAFRFSYLGNDRDRTAWERASRESFENVA
jgi:hypothetical protein